MHNLFRAEPSRRWRCGIDGVSACSNLHVLVAPMPAYNKDGREPPSGQSRVLARAAVHGDDRSLERVLGLSYHYTTVVKRLGAHFGSLTR